MARLTRLLKDGLKEITSESWQIIITNNIGRGRIIRSESIGLAGDIHVYGGLVRKKKVEYGIATAFFDGFVVGGTTASLTDNPFYVVAGFGVGFATGFFVSRIPVYRSKSKAS